MFALYLLLQFLSKFLKGWFFIIPGSKSCKWVKKNPEKSGIRGENLVFLRQNIYYTVGTLNPDFDKNMLLLKNSQYLPDHYETLTQ